jgi:CheY-like chemotaxis protein
METKRILIVDDDKVTLKALESILMRAGYSVTPISLGKEAIRIARTDSIDLIILDIMMPDMDGGEVAYVLKNDPETKDIPVMFLSSLITKKEEKSSSKRDGICLLSKPYDREELLYQIKKYIYLKS